MITNRNFQVDVRGITREIASRIAAEPFVRDFTSVAKFIDNNTSSVARVIATFYLAQISQQREANVNSVRQLIADLVDSQFCLHARDLTSGQLLEIKHTIFQAVASGFFTRMPHSTGKWDLCKLQRLSNDNYTITCQMQSNIQLKRGVTRINVHTTDRFRPVYQRAA